MKKDFSLSIALIFCFFSLAGVFSLAGFSKLVESSDTKTCLEVKEELDRSVSNGMITQAIADSITSRCFNSFID